MIKTTNRKASFYINNKQEFKGSNTYGEWINNNYVVYSYGKHFPIYLYNTSKDQWFGNEDKYSQTTSVHQSQLKPIGDIIYISTKELKQIINN